MTNEQRIEERDARQARIDARVATSERFAVAPSCLRCLDSGLAIGLVQRDRPEPDPEWCVCDCAAGLARTQRLCDGG